MRTSTRMHCVAAVPLAVFAAAAATASVSNTARVDIIPSSSGGSGPYTQEVTMPGTVDAGGSATGGFSSSGQATSHVSYGVIQLSGASLGNLNSSARGTVRDEITITAPGVAAGTPGTLTYSVLINGVLGATSGSSAATWHLQSDVGGGPFDINRSGQCYSPELNPNGCVGDPLGTYSATVSFQYGSPLPLYVELTLTAGASNGGSGPGAAQFGAPFTLNWSGISNVTANGSPVDSFSVGSASGTNWTGSISPTPCPADINQSGTVDGADLGELLAAWGGTAPDLTGDGVVNGADLGALLGAWGPCR